MLGRNPNLWEHVGPQKVRQGEYIDLVGLDTSFSNQFDLGGMHDNRATDQRGEQVVDRPGIGGRLNHDCISGKQIGLRPLRPAREFNPARWKHDALMGINATNHEVVLVDVDGDVACPELKGRVSHARLLLPNDLNGGARICGLNGSHTDTSATSCYWPLRCEDPTGSQITSQIW